MDLNDMEHPQVHSAIQPIVSVTDTISVVELQNRLEHLNEIFLVTFKNGVDCRKMTAFKTFEEAQTYAQNTCLLIIDDLSENAPPNMWFEINNNHGYVYYKTWLSFCASVYDSFEILTVPFVQMNY